jgi:HSP20 family protein
MVETTTKMPVKTEKATASASSGNWPFQSLRREIDRLFDDFNPLEWRWARSVLDVETPRFARTHWMVTPAMDLVEKKTCYEITAELPGIDEKDVEIRLANHTLTIKGEKAEEKEEKEKDHYLSERRYGSFQRSFQVPESVDTSRIEAGFAKGVLKVTLPKTADAQKAEKKIEVKAA